MGEWRISTDCSTERGGPKSGGREWNEPETGAAKRAAGLSQGKKRGLTWEGGSAQPGDWGPRDSWKERGRRGAGGREGGGDSSAQPGPRPHTVAGLQRAHLPGHLREGGQVRLRLQLPGLKQLHPPAAAGRAPQVPEVSEAWAWELTAQGGEDRGRSAKALTGCKDEQLPKGPRPRPGGPTVGLMDGRLAPGSGSARSAPLLPGPPGAAPKRPQACTAS